MILLQWFYPMVFMLLSSLVSKPKGYLRSLARDDMKKRDILWKAPNKLQLNASMQVILVRVNTYMTSRLRVNYLCIFLLIAVDKLGFYMYVFLIYVCLQKRCLRLICLSSTVHTCSIKISDLNTMVRHIELVNSC